MPDLLGDTVDAASGDPDAELVRRVQHGDAGAFDLLVRRHMRRAFCIAYRLLEQREDAEDLVQDAFIAALQGIDGFESGRSFAPWLARIVVNRGLNARKARALRQTEALPEQLAARAAGPDCAAEQAELQRGLRRALAALPERQRIAVELFELEGFSGSEIAEILDLPAGTVRWYLHQGRKALRQVLAPHADTVG